MLSYDQRWHGDSEVKRRLSGGESGGGGVDPGACHVARLAVDLEGVLDAVLGGSESDEPQQQVTCVGTSLGAAVLWSHYELFRGGKASRGEKDDEGAPSAAATTTARTSSKKTTPLPPPRIHRVVYVDQAPLQNRTPDWLLGSKGCYDGDTLAGLQAAVRALDDDDTGGDGDENNEKKNAFARGNAEACLSMAIPAELDALLAAETGKASGEALARLMADHTRGDWRAVVRSLDAQEALVVAGAESRIFPVDGCRWVASHAPRAKCVVFRGCGHWLYVERPDEFAGRVARVAAGGRGAVEGGEV